MMNKDIKLVMLGGMIGGAIAGAILAWRYEKLLTKEQELNQILIDELNVVAEGVGVPKRDKLGEVIDDGKKKSGRYPWKEQNVAETLHHTDFDGDTLSVDKVLDKAKYRPVSTDPYDKVEISMPEKTANPVEDEVAKEPYLINMEQFCEECTNWDKESMTYWAGDDVVADKNEEPVPEFREVVGEQFKHSFGYSGSDDPNIVYVRNESVECDYEIMLDDRKYGEVVCGFDE